MDTDRIAGSAKDFAGKVESAAGDIAGDTTVEASRIFLKVRLPTE